MLTAWIPLTLTCYPSLSTIALGKSSKWYLVFEQSFIGNCQFFTSVFLNNQFDGRLGFMAYQFL